ncbi:hypothetical protein [Sphingomonas sp.]|uniref:hypothetical protein n=1 Tax=Sphingomonas sp. TaxID=28214 RepID=UPI0025F26AB4|nr:hypothetical protein [Sphingomonas sp.]
MGNVVAAAIAFVGTHFLLSHPLCAPIVGRIGELVDWLARIREQGHRLHLLPEVLALRRARPGSLTYDRDAACSSAYLLAARKAILRRRETPAR